MLEKDKAKLILSLTDLTTLNDDDNSQKIIDLCKKATSIVPSAAVCIYPKFISIAKKALRDFNNNFTKVATVINFPSGNSSRGDILREGLEAIEFGADEIDLVFPYKDFIKRRSHIDGYELISAMKLMCSENNKNLKLKVIIESGELKDPGLIAEISEICIEAGADFIKTSTGKTQVSARLEDSKEILTTIFNMGAINSCGFKASGGITTVNDAFEYINLATSICGEGFIKPETFRFGASSLFNDIAKTLDFSIEKYDINSY